MRHRLAFVLLTAASAAAGCHAETKSDEFVYRPDLRPSVYFPLAVGTAWSYNVTDPARADTLLLINRVISRDGNRAIFSAPPDPMAYVDAGDRITMEPAGKIVLQAPLTVGAQWPIKGGTATIRSVDARAETPAGTWSSCLVVEENLGPGRVVTTYAPNVGPVQVEVYGRDLQVEIPMSRAVLRGYSKAGSQAP